jgi:hypothetical protein
MGGSEGRSSIYARPLNAAGTVKGSGSDVELRGSFGAAFLGGGWNRSIF